MNENQLLPAPKVDWPRKGPHPVFVVAAASVAAVALLAAAQMLRPVNASSVATAQTTLPTTTARSTR
jgi:hypothetical protein